MRFYRKLLPVESDAYCRHLLRLDSNERYARFCGAASDRTVQWHCDRLDWRRTQVIGCFDDGVLRAAVELHSNVDHSSEAEVGISVEAAIRGQGVGASLLRRALILARNRGLSRVMLHCLATNRRVQALVIRTRGRLEFDIDECRGTIDPGRPDPVSQLHEMIDDGVGVAACLSDAFFRLADALAIPSRALIPPARF